MSARVNRHTIATKVEFLLVTNGMEVSILTCVEIEVCLHSNRLGPTGESHRQGVTQVGLARRATNAGATTEFGEADGRWLTLPHKAQHHKLWCFELGNLVRNFSHFRYKVFDY